MNSLAVLPIFLRLGGVKAVLAGNGEPAAWKTELLAAAGADLLLMSPDPAPKLEEAAARAGVEIQRRAWTPADFQGAVIALLEAEDDEAAERFRAAARAAGALVNVIDRPKFCDFSFGSIVERSPLVIGISTDGAAPVFAQAIRAKIETMVPETLRSWAQTAREWRGRFSGLEPRRRRAIWLDFADRAFASVDRTPQEADFQALSLGVRPGRLVVVGTGTGSPDDLTQRAVRALQAADHVVADGPVNAALRDLGRREATFELWPEGAGEDARASLAARVAAGQTVAVLVRGDGRATAWEGAEIAPGVSP